VEPRQGEGWSATNAGHVPGGLEVLSIATLSQPSDIEWVLPASKSHAIRWVLRGALNGTPMTLHGVNGLGEDAESMLRVLEQLGLRVMSNDDAWVLHPPEALRRPSSLLHVGNSGTALRLVAAAVSHTGHPVTLDGDASLRRRGLGDLSTLLVQQGVRVRADDADDRLPVDLHGPWSEDSLPPSLRRDRSSQPASALLLSSSLQSNDVDVQFEGQPRSSRHLALSAKIAEACGWPGRLGQDGMHLPCWDVEAPAEVNLPGDASMAAFAMLWVRSTGGSIHLKRWPTEEDALGCELLLGLASDLGLEWSVSGRLRAMEDTGEPVDVDLCDANDLLPPLAALLALGPGGRLHGAPHAVHKESNRIQGIIEVLDSFGLKAAPTEDGVVVPGGQRPSSPNRPVDAREDHRLMMTATCLGAAVGAEVIGPRLHCVADPRFLDRLSKAGLSTQARMVPP
jgi:3-phosphoshikimate 1-carboxyvinyltransferase